MKIISYTLLKEDVVANVINSDQKVTDINNAFQNIGGEVKQGY